jgi:phosphoribosylaminoimidazole (AIR) synthetase
MRAERPILLRFLNVLTSLNDFIIKRIVFLFLVKYIASGTLSGVVLDRLTMGLTKANNQ